MMILMNWMEETHMNPNRTLLLCAALVLLTGCATVRHNTIYLDSTFSVGKLANSSITFYCGGNVFLDEFKKSFSSEYGSNEAYIAEMSSLFISELSSVLPKAEIIRGKSTNIDPLMGVQS